MSANKMSPPVEKPSYGLGIDNIGEKSLNESVDMDKDYRPIVGELHKFVLEGKAAELKKFLLHQTGDEVWKFTDFAKLFEERDGLGRTPLQLALAKGLPNMVNALFEAANYVNSQDLNLKITEKMCMKSFKNLHRDTTPVIILALSAAAEKKKSSTDKAIKCVKVLIENTKLLKNGELVKEMLTAKASFKRGVLHYAGQLGEKKLITYLIALHKEFFLFEEAIMEECAARKLPLHYAIDSNDKDSIKVMFSETLGTKNKDVIETLILRVSRYCVRRSLLLFLDICGCNEADKHHRREIVHKRAESDFSKRILSPRKRSAPGMDESQAFSSEDYTKKVITKSAECKTEKGTAILTDKSCFDHLQMPSVDGAEQYTIIQNNQENPHRLEVVLGALTSLGDQVKWIPASKKSRWVMPWISKVHTKRYVDMVKQSVTSSEQMLGKSLEDNYTSVSTRSLDAAKGAVRSVLNSIDTVMENEDIRNAFAAVRPPGHHIGPDGMTNTWMDYDRQEHLGNCIFNNVAIAAVYAMEKYPETIKKVAIMDFDIHHGNGTEKVVYERSSNSNEKWFYASVHGHDGEGVMFYPGSGFNIDTEILVNVELGIRHGNKPASSRELRSKFRKHVTKGLNAFKPDLIIISAGFDGHENCFVHATNFKDEDYTWMTEEIMTVANRHCEGRIVSVLEGGYNTRAGYFSPLAQSVLAHANALKNYSSDIVVFKPLERELSEL